MGGFCTVNNGYYEVTVEGCVRRLPICPVSDKFDIAAFIMFGDTELTVKSAAGLIRRCGFEYDILITAEAKGIPLCYEMARQTNKKYIVARKGPKIYMNNPVHIKVKSITTKRMQNLYLSGDDYASISGKKILIIDDVISTGASLRAIEELVCTAGGEISGKAAVLAEGDAVKRSDIVFLETIPLFFR
jgi:adenine phosphoribosyltransferase